MQHGQTRTLVRLMRAVYVDDGEGGFLPQQWTEVSSFYARVRPISTSETFSVGGEQASTSWSVSATFRLDIQERDVLVIEPDELRVLEVTGFRDPDLRRRQIDIDAIERRLDDEEEQEWRTKQRSSSKLTA